MKPFVDKKNVFWAALCLMSVLFVAYSLPFRHRNKARGAAMPRLTVVVVFDQGAYRELQRAKEYFSGGLKTLLQHGVVYENAYYPHALPETAVGHTALNAGAFAKDHGIVANAWVDGSGKQVLSDDDNDLFKSAVFAPHGFYNEGKSAHNIMTDGLSDQVALSSRPAHARHVYSVSLKSRAAIGMAGRLGKACWFDTKSGNFTSSKAYFEQLPEWLAQFNATRNPVQSTVQWNPAVNIESAHYQFAERSNYTFAEHKSLLGVPFKLEDEKSLSLFEKTPMAAQLLFDCAWHCAQAVLPATGNDSMLLWVSVSSLDLVGHVYGPDSMEVLDMWYHLDHQLGAFMRNIEQRYGTKDTLFVFTADHGVDAIEEILHQRGLHQASRIPARYLIEQVNAALYRATGIHNLVLPNAVPGQLYVNQEKFQFLTHEQQRDVVTVAKKALRVLPCIKDAWGSKELDTHMFDEHDYAYLFKQQQFAGRSGDIFYLTYPHHLVTAFDAGTSHATPYNYDTHVPLIMYSPARFEAKKVYAYTWMLQLANTLATILQVPAPSCAMRQLLPALFSPAE